MDNKSNSKTLLLILTLLHGLLTFSSCGLAYQKHITGRYYIVGVDDKDDLSLGYKLSSGEYVGKAPGRIIEYGFNDRFLIAKSQEYNKATPTYYIIDMIKDAELANEGTFRIGPLSETEFNTTWKPKLNVQFNKVK